MRAAFLASLLAPMAEIRTVMQAPIFCPMITGTAVAPVTAPERDNACKIPTDAEELCTMAVIIKPTSTPKSGLENMVSILVNSGTSASPFTAPLMVSIPIIRMAKPAITVPTVLCFSFLVKLIRITPINASTGAKDDGLKS